jgi:ABC-type transport system involved in multi-copper enzyme maturation permease subunit
MFKFYLFSIIFWFILLLLLIQFSSKHIVANGWTDINFTPSYDPAMMLVLVAATPGLRLIIAACFIVMSSVTREEYDAWIKGDKHDN